MQRVLVVDDYEDNLELFVEEMRAAGFEVTGTTDPNEALNLAILTKPAVVVMDISMPNLDGYELAALLRAYAATRDARLVAVSAHVFAPGQVPPGGWDACLRKPLEPGMLASTVRAVLGSELPEAARSGSIRVDSEPPPSSRAAKG